jgi:alanine dehydrogenase
LSPADADDVAVIGAGWQAESQLEGIAMVRPLRRIRVFSRRVANRNRFADTMSQRLGIQVAPSQSAAAAVQGAAIIVTATTAPTPVLADADLAPGAHINAIGSNAAGRRELEAATVLRASRLVVDSREQCRQEAGDLLAAFADQDSGWDCVEELATVVAAGPRPRDPGALTLFKSTGMAIWDVACAAAIWEQAG